MPTAVTDWMSQHGGAWERAVVHPFLDQCADGTIDPRAFNRWLVQDRLFVLEFTRFAARLVQTCPVAHLDTLLGGMGALKDELLWFEAKADERGLTLDVRPLQACSDYCAFMRGLYKAPYPVQAVGFWAIERAYNEAWQRPGPMPAPYDEFADRWGNPGFSAYVEQLTAQADEALAATNETERRPAEVIFLDIAGLESRFWQMAFADNGHTM